MSEGKPGFEVSHRLVERHADVRYRFIVESEHDGHRHSHDCPGQGSEGQIVWLTSGPYGKVPSEVTLQEAQCSAWLAALGDLGSLKAALGDFDRISAWLMVTGYVNAEPGYPQATHRPPP